MGKLAPAGADSIRFTGKNHAEVCQFLGGTADSQDAISIECLDAACPHVHLLGNEDLVDGLVLRVSSPGIPIVRGDFVVRTQAGYARHRPDGVSAEIRQARSVYAE